MQPITLINPPTFDHPERFGYIFAQHPNTDCITQSDMGSSLIDERHNQDERHERDGKKESHHARYLGFTKLNTGLFFTRRQVSTP